MITGGVKTTPVLAMQLLCDRQLFTNIIEKNAAILFNRLIRLPNNSFWRDYDSDGGLINDVPFELLSFANPLDYTILDIRLDLVLNVRKRDLSPTALHAIALETINTRFPPKEWLHIYTDGSLFDFAQGAGIGVFSHLFYLHTGPLTTHFDGEVEAIHIALQQLAVRLPPIERAVILSDSTSALLALSNYNENNCLRVQNCRELLGKIKNFHRDLTLHSAKLEIKRIFRESFRLTASRVARDKPWSTLCKKSHGIPSSPRAAAVTKFRLLTGHDCLCAHLFRFNLVASPICVLCDTGQDMTAAHLDECSALNDLNCITLTDVPTSNILPYDGELSDSDLDESNYHFQSNEGSFQAVECSSSSLAMSPSLLNESRQISFRNILFHRQIMRMGQDGKCKNCNCILGTSGLPSIVTRKKTCAIQWVPTHVNMEGNDYTDSLTKEARNINPSPIKTTCPDVNAIAKHRLCDSPRKKWCLPELNHEHAVTTTISRMLVGHMRGMKIMLEGSRTYTECRHCPGVQLDPGHLSFASLLPRPYSIETPTAAMTPFTPIKSVMWPELYCMSLTPFDFFFSALVI
ncbi:uncharacterized protein LOC103524116 [Trichonephila clavipes]|nr:uncharacterized protein LOC103524116 [Trichonephila clavipes]